MEVIKAMTAREVTNLIDWLRAQGFDNDKIAGCIKTVEGKKTLKEQKDEETRNF